MTNSNVRGLHPKARERLLQLLFEALSTCDIVDGAPNTWTERFSAVRDLVGRLRGEWLSDSDANNLIAQEARTSLDKHGLGKASGEMGKALKPETIKDLCSRVAGVIESVPHDYRVLFPLPGFDVKQEVKVTDSVSFVRTPSKEADKGMLSGLLSSNWKQTERSDATYLSVIAKGYATWHMRQSAMTDASSVMKRVLEIGIAKSAFIQDYSFNPNTTLAAIFGQPSATILQAVVYDLTDTSVSPVVIGLPLGMSMFLQRLQINDGTKTKSSFRPPRIDPARKEEDLRALLTLPTFLLTEANAEEHTESLRSALEWNFDAHADDDETASFIKTCIALEAALGEESESDQITERLADRCAFLINRVATQRSGTRRLVKEVYKLRSKLVHGKKTKLAPADADLVNSAEVHLILVLQKETEALESWWKSLK